MNKQVQSEVGLLRTREQVQMIKYIHETTELLDREPRCKL